MRLTVYTRETDADSYPFGLAAAVHFSVEKDGQLIALNRDYGILFAEGVISKENTIIPLGIANPTLFCMEDGFIGIAGRRILGDGTPFPADGSGMWAWKTSDLIHFETLGLVEETFVMRHSHGSRLEMGDDVAEAAIHFWNPPAHTKDPSVTEYQFPLAEGYGDPVIFPWEGKWYYIISFG